MNDKNIGFIKNLNLFLYKYRVTFVYVIEDNKIKLEILLE